MISDSCYAIFAVNIVPHFTLKEFLDLIVLFFLKTEDSEVSSVNSLFSGFGRSSPHWSRFHNISLQSSLLAIQGRIAKEEDFQLHESVFPEILCV